MRAIKRFWIILICLGMGVSFSVSVAFAEDLILQETLSSGTYFSQGKIIARDGCVVPSGSNVTLTACVGITLEPGFRVELGGTLNARIVEPPSMSIQILEPDGVLDTCDQSFTIRWDDYAPNTSAVISLYYDQDGTGADGVLIVSDLSEDPDGPGFDEYVWDTSGMPAGEYYIYAVISDGVLSPVVAYSAGTVTIDHGLISSDFERILIGGSATLSWNCPGATSVTIDNGLGAVPVQGSLIVSPTETTVYTITAEGPWGTHTDTVTVTVVPLMISITSPSEGATVDRATVTVEGTISDVPGFEIGVSVNGVVAMVDGDHFAANRVALEQGQNTITATAVDTFGHTVSDLISVNAEISGDYVLITADPESGVSPFETTLRIEASFNFSTSSLDYTGPGTVEFISNPDPSEYRVRMTIPGLYAFTVEVADSESNLHNDTVTVLVLDAEIFDGMLKEKWSAMKNALSSGDVPKAMGYIAGGGKDMYQYNFNLMNAYLGEIAAGLQNIGMVNIKNNKAEYEMWAQQDGQMYSFYVLFVKDADGIWRIRFF